MVLGFFIKNRMRSLVRFLSTKIWCFSRMQKALWKSIRVDFTWFRYFILFKCYLILSFDVLTWMKCEILIKCEVFIMKIDTIMRTVDIHHTSATMVGDCYRKGVLTHLIALCRPWRSLWDFIQCFKSFSTHSFWRDLPLARLLSRFAFE